MCDTCWVGYSLYLPTISLTKETPPLCKVVLLLLHFKYFLGNRPNFQVYRSSFPLMQKPKHREKNCRLKVYQKPSLMLLMHDRVDLCSTYKVGGPFCSTCSSKLILWHKFSTKRTHYIYRLLRYSCIKEWVKLNTKFDWFRFS